VLGLGEGNAKSNHTEHERISFWDGMSVDLVHGKHMMHHDHHRNCSNFRKITSTSTNPCMKNGTTVDQSAAITTTTKLPPPSSDTVWLVKIEKIQFRLEMIMNEVPLTVAALTLRILCDQDTSSHDAQGHVAHKLIHLDYVDFTWLPQFLFTTQHMGVAMLYYHENLQKGDTVHAAFNGDSWLEGTVTSTVDQHLIKATQDRLGSLPQSGDDGSGNATFIDSLALLPPMEQIQLVQKYLASVEVKWHKNVTRPPPPTDDAAESMIDPLDRTTIDPLRFPVSSISPWEIQEVISVDEWEQRLSEYRPYFDEDLRFYFLEKLYSFTSSKNHANLQYLNYRYPYPITAVLVYDRLNQRYYRHLEAFQMDIIHLLDCLSTDSRDQKLNSLGKKAVKALHRLVEDFNHLIAERKLDRVLQPKSPSRILKRKRLQFTMMVPEASDMDEISFQRVGRFISVNTSIFPSHHSTPNHITPHYFYSRIDDGPLIPAADDADLELELEDRAPFPHNVQCKTLYVCKWQDKNATSHSLSKDDGSRCHENGGFCTNIPFCAPNKDAFMNTTIEMQLTTSQRNAFKLLMTSIDNALLQDDRKSDLDEMILERYSFLHQDKWRWCTSGFYFKTERKHLKTERGNILCEMLQLCAVKNSLQILVHHPCASIQFSI